MANILKHATTITIHAAIYNPPKSQIDLESTTTEYIIILWFLQFIKKSILWDINLYACIYDSEKLTHFFIYNLINI